MTHLERLFAGAIILIALALCYLVIYAIITDFHNAGLWVVKVLGFIVIAYSIGLTLDQLDNITKRG